MFSDRCRTPWKMAPPDAHLCTYCVKEHNEGLHIGSLRLIQPYRFQSSLWSYGTPSNLSFFLFCKQMWNIDMHYTWKHPIQTNRYTSPVVSLPFVPLLLLCRSCYLQICWCCHNCIGHTHTHTHNMSTGLYGVNMFGDIMPDHLIMTRPLGSRACLLFRTPYMLLIIQFSHNALQHYRFISQKGFRWLQRLTEESAVFQFSFTEGDNWCVFSFSITAIVSSNKSRWLFSTYSLTVVACPFLITYHFSQNVLLSETL